MTNTEILVGTKVLIKKTIMEDKHAVAVAEQMAELAGKIVTVDWVGTLATNKKIIAEYGVKGNDGKLYYFDDSYIEKVVELLSFKEVMATAKTGQIFECIDKDYRIASLKKTRDTFVFNFRDNYKKVAIADDRVFMENPDVIAPYRIYTVKAVKSGNLRHVRSHVQLEGGQDVIYKTSEGKEVKAVVINSTFVDMTDAKYMKKMLAKPIED